ISKEPFMSNVTWINELKLRAGYGLNGNDNVGNYNIYSTFRTNYAYSFYNIVGTSNTESQAGYHKYKLGNPNAKWESTETQNIGLDGSFFNNRLYFNVDFFTRRTTGMLYPDSRPSSWGIVVLPSI